MQKEERQQKFHEALLDMLYPPPSPPHLVQDGGEPLNVLSDGLNLNRTRGADELGQNGSSSSSCSEDGDEIGPGKLSRAQRKRLRKRKLKEEASRRRKIIGPLLPADSGDDGHGNPRNEPQGVRRNVSEESEIGDKPGDAAACKNYDKIKHRRMAKKLARERLKPPATENSVQGYGPLSKNGSLTKE
ncbi:uncharacterized protein LOC127803101 isoform X2 [Diospyros lotus]|uniref:uncharacterized protein LOC127803101 isoform X2 n=1 Tax=Diospyros lotus TaxID=55363 RepID=UPI0022594E03|nr:uncharacterized protein LOC127803101 isoform X2 [Diospyros lotus]